MAPPPASENADAEPLLLDDDAGSVGDERLGYPSVDRLVTMTAGGAGVVTLRLGLAAGASTLSRLVEAS